MTIDKDFNNHAPETYADREKRLEDRIKQIEDRLTKPQAPQPQLRPEGAMRKDGDDLGRKVANDQRVDLVKELETVRREQAQRHQPRNGNSKSL